MILSHLESRVKGSKQSKTFCWRLLLFDSLDQMDLLHQPSRVAKKMIARNPYFNLGYIDLDSSSWTKSLLRRMGFVKRMKTTGKVKIPRYPKEWKKKTKFCIFLTLHHLLKSIIFQTALSWLLMKPLSGIYRAQPLTWQRKAQSLSELQALLINNASREHSWFHWKEISCRCNSYMEDYK